MAWSTYIDNIFLYLQACITVNTTNVKNVLLDKFEFPIFQKNINYCVFANLFVPQCTLVVFLKKSMDLKLIQIFLIASIKHIRCISSTWVISHPHWGYEFCSSSKTPSMTSKNNGRKDTTQKTKD